MEEVEAFYSVDDNLLTSAPGDIDGIAEAFMPTIDSDSDEETSDADTASRAISRKDLNDAIWLLKIYTCTNDKPMPEVYKHVCEAEKGIDKHFAASKKQKSITDFFM